ncbi:MAG: hydroxymethylbilane synthase, partial [Rhizobiaceae bacterium]
LELSCFLPREEIADAFICLNHASIEELPERAVVGSASLRRQALIRRMRPDIQVVNYRGNVQTRLRKLAEGEVDATILAQAGLNRLGMSDRITGLLPVDHFPPAPGQGAICVETRTGDQAINDLLAPINDRDTFISLSCERAFLAGLDGSCRTPIAGNAKISGEHLAFHGMILRPDGSEVHETHLEGSIADCVSIGEDAASILRDKAGESFFESWA